MAGESGNHIDSSQGSVPSEQLDFAELERAANDEDLGSFLKAVRIVNWPKASGAELVKAVQYALSLGAYALAQELAQLGERLHSEDPVVRRIAQILAPAKVLRTDLPPDPRVLQNHE